METAYISIKELSKALGVNKQKAYEIINKDEYKEYIIIDNGIKRVDIELLHKLQGVNKPTESNNNSKPIENHNNSPKIDIDYIEYLKAEIKELKATVNNRDSTIAELTKRITALTERQQELIEKSLTLTSQQQQLTALTTQQETKKESRFKRLFGRHKEE